MSYEPIFSRFPLADLGYILVSGIITVILFPHYGFSNDYGFFNFFKLSNWTFSDYMLGIVITGFVVGLGFYILRNILFKIHSEVKKSLIKTPQSLNKWIIQIKKKSPLIIRKKLICAIKKLPKKNQNNSSLEQPMWSIPFNKWLRKTGRSKFISFTYSIKLWATGALHSSEFCFVITSLFVLFGLIPFDIEFLQIFLILIFSFIIQRVSKKNFENVKKIYQNEYEKQYIRKY